MISDLNSAAAIPASALSSFQVDSSTFEPILMLCMSGVDHTGISRHSTGWYHLIRVSMKSGVVHTDFL